MENERDGGDAGVETGEDDAADTHDHGGDDPATGIHVQ